jgi:hypothetical protein
MASGHQGRPSPVLLCVAVVLAALSDGAAAARTAGAGATVGLALFFPHVTFFYLQPKTPIDNSQ